MRADTGKEINTHKVDGGAAMNDLLMQFQADVLDKKVCRSAVGETTALGAACLAGLAVGVWKDIEELKDIWSPDRVFVPELDTAHRERILRDWHRAVERSAGWAG
jgi:glycerol kinase